MSSASLEGNDDAVLPFAVEPLDASPRGTHTITSPGPLPSRGRPAAAAVGFLIAILTAAGAGIAGTWFVLRQRPDPSPPPDTAAVPDATVTTEPVAPEPPPVEPTAVVSPTDPPAEASSSSPNADRMRTAKTATSAEASSAPVSTPPRPCDPPYFIDAQGIRRVKRECF